MRTIISGLSLLVLLSITLPAHSQGVAADGASADAVRESDPEFLLIRAHVENFAEAFNSGRADEIAKLFTESAELVDSSGTVFRGRETIQAEYQAFFEVHPEASVAIQVDEIKFVAPNVAIEEDHVTSQLSPGSPPSVSRYSSVYSKLGDDWLLSHVRDEAVPDESGAKLQELSWLIGRWVDEAPDSLMTIDCYWHESGSYLIRDFEIKVEGLLASRGTERIGWDPLQRKVRSWLFDSEGGFLEGTWVKQGTQWTIATHGFRPDGVPTHATYTVTPLRDEAYHLNAVSRAAGEEQLDDFEMTIVHGPPSPGEVPVLESGSNKPTPSDKSRE